MQIIFSNKRLQKLANSSDRLTKEFVIRVAQAIQKRLYDLRAYETLQDIPTSPPFRRHKLKGKYRDCFAVDVLGRRHPQRIVFQPVDEAGNQLEKYELHEVKVIKIIFIGDYH